MNSDGRQPASGFRNDRFSLAVERFNQQAMRLTRPGPHWLRASVKLGLVLATTSLLAALLLIAALLISHWEWPGERRGYSYTEWIIIGVILGPLVETGLISLIHLLTRRWLGISGFVLVNTILFAAMHIPAQVVPIPATIAFLVMSYQYVSFRNDIGRSRAFVGVAVCHAVNNALVIVLTSTFDLLGL